MKNSKIEQLKIKVNELVKNVMDYGANRSFSLTLDRYAITLNGSASISLQLYFDMLVVNPEIGLDLQELLLFREWVMCELTKLYPQYQIKIAQAPINAKRIELTTNIEEQFGDGFLSSVELLVTVPFL